VCRPDVELAKQAGRNVSGLNGVGFEGIMYSPEICTQTSPRKLRNALTSFPSGHATVACAGFGFLFLWTNAKFKVWAAGRPAFWKLLAVTVPLLQAALIAGSLTIDNAHNTSDIIMGAVIGVLLALGSYRMVYASVWGYGYNHIPLQLGRGAERETRA
jgi:diacylglycerol diphosphate phosphatase/phosphatidate phosphatase